MPRIATLEARIEANVDGFVRGMNTAQTGLQTFVQKTGSATAAAEKLNQSFAQTTDKLIRQAVGFDANAAVQASGFNRIAAAAATATKSFAPATEAITHLKREIALMNDNTRQAALQYDILNGVLREASVVEKQEILSLAKKADALVRVQAQQKADSRAAGEAVGKHR